MAIQIMDSKSDLQKKEKHLRMPGADLPACPTKPLQLIQHVAQSAVFNELRVHVTQIITLHCLPVPVHITSQRGVFGVEEITVSLILGDCVTLHTGVKTNQQDRIRWYYNDIRIAQITRDRSKTCTDVQCDGKFRDRLKLNNQTGSLTITNIMTSDAGLYKLKILDSPSSEKIFNATVHDQMKTAPVQERNSVTLYTGVAKSDDLITWYFNDILIAETLISGHLNEICMDIQCKETFRNRLQLDNQTGSLTITNTRTTDSGLYKLQINSSSSSSSIIRNFSIAVFILPVLILAVAVGVIWFSTKHKRKNQECSTANRRND
ncbi:uncharacterized protein LOC127158287 [Labeo rohita]|uniref:uncharacterized protein LOC127158287 n=1 Tax=Labeo rohita TaxID=84645 RepID=UPI0021E27186|nr:uncharacterized protein LOC127158287 [Labeo rohita]